MHHLRALFDIRRHELPQALGMGVYFFLVITSFWVLKPLKKALFIEHYDVRGLTLGTWRLDAASAELLAKLLNVVVAYLAVVAFTLLARRRRRQQLSLVFCGFFLVSYGIYAQLLRAPGPATVWSFYLFGDLFSTLMVATFFAFLSDVAAPDQAKRSYGLVGLGGVLGGLIGSACIATWIGRIPHTRWMAICAVLTAAIALVAWLVGRAAPPMVPPRAACAQAQPSVLWEGARLAVRSRYLWAVIAMVGLYELVSSLMDFQFSASVAHYADGAAIGRHFAQTFLVANLVAVGVQLTLTGWVMRRLGQPAALSVLPMTSLVASVAFLAVPVLPMAKLLNIADNGFAYSIQQSAKEALYVPRNVDEKYKAKAFIDMFVQRAAKAIGVLVTLLLTALVADFAALRWLSLLTLGLCGAWLMVARYAGRRFEALASPTPLPGSSFPIGAPNPQQVP